MANLIPAPHPGETIREDVLEPLGMSVNQLAKALGITATRLNDVVRGRRGITADTALRLARYLGTSAEFWLGLQLEYDLRTARQISATGNRESSSTAVCCRLDGESRHAIRNQPDAIVMGGPARESNLRRFLQRDLGESDGPTRLRRPASRGTSASWAFPVKLAAPCLFRLAGYSTLTTPSVLNVVRMCREHAG